MNDATCPKCSKRFGWPGKLTDCPPCPCCNYQIPKESWENDEKEMQKFRDYLSQRKK